MEVKNEHNLCRLCYTPTVKYIDLFVDSILNAKVVDLLKQYFNDEVNESDVFPKVICIGCWDKVESFHKFSEFVIALRESYLLQHLNNAVKDESIEEFVIPNVEPDIHREMVCVDPLIPIKMAVEEEDEILELNEYTLQYESEDERKLSNDAEAYEETFEPDELPVSSNHGRNPWNISDSSQRQGNISQPLRTFICDICQKAFTFYSGVERHILNVHAAKIGIHAPNHSCNQCGQTFKTQKHLENHLAVGHSNSLEDYVNEVKCMKFNISEAQAKTIMEKYFDQKCQLCGAQMDTFELAKEHYSTEHENPKGYLRCCGNKLINIAETMDHIQYHIDPDIFRCRLCNKQCIKRFNLTSHLKRHKALSTKQFACDICHQYYGNGRDLKAHAEHEHPETQFSSVGTNSYGNDIELPDYVDASCTKCPVTNFKSFKEMRSHCLETHKSFGSVLCCKKKYFLISLFRDHIAWHKNPDVYRCDVCEKSLTSRVVWARHNQRHSNKYQCHICQKSFDCKSYLMQHLITHENRQRNFACDVCDKRFLRKKYLDIHRETHASQTIDYMCEFCAKNFKTAQQLKYHQKTKHSDAPKTPKKVKPKLQCDVCNKWYTNKYILATHKSMKHESKPIKCSQCDKFSPNQSALEQHIKVVHSGLDFKCDICNKGLKSQTSLRDHIATHSNQKSYKCNYCDESFIWRPNFYAHRKKMHKNEWLADKAEKISP